MKSWWINNSWKFWDIRWAWSDDAYLALEIWQEYRYMLNPKDERSLCELIFQEYEKDVARALCNPVVKVLLWIRRWASDRRGDLYQEGGE